MASLAHLPHSQDLDDIKSYERLDEALRSVNTGNFVVEFDGEKASSVLNIDEASMENVLQAKSNRSTIWINILGPERQKDLVKRLAAQYDFSPRLSGLMCSDHTNAPPLTQTSLHHHHYHHRFREKLGRRASLEIPFTDLEKNSENGVITMPPQTPHISHYKMASEVWHYCSVDWGKKCKTSLLPFQCRHLTIADLSISYNSLSDPSAVLNKYEMSSPRFESGSKDIGKDKMKGVRTWSWLVLCDDGKPPTHGLNPPTYSQTRYRRINL